jgi:hypothetical protein
MTHAKSSVSALVGDLEVTRRTLIGRWMAAALAGGTLGSVSGLAQNPAPPNEASPSAGPIRAFYETLTMEQRRRMCFDWDHRGFTGLPLRLHVTNNWAISPVSINSFSEAQQRLVDDILASVLSPGWPERLKRQARDDTGQAWGAQKIAIFGAPERGPCQCVVTGFHLTLRATCERNPAVAFSGALVHGHQPSGFNERVGHPNNFFWYQAQLANQVYQGMDREQRQRALVTRDMPFYMFEGRIDRRNILPDTRLPIPLEPDVRFQGPRGTFPGMPIRDMSREQKLLANLALDGLLQPYRREYQEQVRRCLQRQGGLEACSMAFYQERDLGNDGEWDNWRIEGPSFVWYYRGFPHVHVWIHVADDPNTPVTSHFG